MSRKKTIDVNIISISPLVQQQNEILLNKLLSYNEQQQQQKKSHSQSSNQTNLSHSKKQNCICTKNSKTEQLYRKNLSRILKSLNEYINNLIGNFSQKENEEQNKTHTKLENTHKFRLPENNNSSLFLNNTNDLKSLLSTNAKNEKTKQICDCTKSQKINISYKTHLINIWESLDTLIPILDTYLLNNTTSLYYYNSHPQNNYWNQFHYIETQFKNNNYNQTKDHSNQKRISLNKSIPQIEVPKNKIMNNTQLYGKVNEDTNKNVTKVELYRHQIALTQDEINNLHKETYPIDLNLNKMFRCPLQSCQHQPLNSFYIEKHINSHCQIYHNNDNQQYVFRYQTKFGWKEVHYPPSY